jgi:tricorn protease
LGKVVGTRTWGGVRGIKGPWRLMDGTYMTIPKDALFDTEGHWIIENEGASPDIEIESAPDEPVTGHDTQLEAAIKVALEELDAVVPKGRSRVR